jgi:hypothetical protein
MTNQSMELNDDRPRATKSVRWHTSCAMRIYGKLDETDVSHAWFSEKDYAGFRKKCSALSKLGKKIGADAVEDCCKESCMGLEHLICQKTFNLRKRRREQALTSVLEEQEQQWDSGIDYCETSKKLSMAYRYISNDAHEDARKRALANANEVVSFSDFSMVTNTEASCDRMDEQAVHWTSKHFNGILQGDLVAPSQSAPLPVTRRNWQIQG